MDYLAAKRLLTEKTRERFGETVTIRPMSSGRLKTVDDPSRSIQVDIPARFDFSPDLEKLGGNDRSGPMLNIAATGPTVTVPRHLMSWVPNKPDRFERATGEVWEIVRQGMDGADVFLFEVSKV